MKECPVCRRCFPDQVNHCPSDGDLLKFTIAGDPVLDGRYQLECRLGQGGMGLVYKARHIFLKTPHAIKIILPDLVGNDPSLVTRFRQEAMAAAAIRHPNIVAVTDFGVVNGTTPFLVMEFIQGKSLHDILNEEGRLAPGFAAEIMSGVCAGLSAAHRQGIIHRDLKPLNVMLRDEAPSVHEGVKLLDFGLAKIKSGELLGSFVAAQTTGLMGSPFYMAPEQWGEEEPDRRADIYSLGVIAYQMLAGEVPFKGPSIPAIMKKHLTGDVPGLVERNASVPPEMERAVMRALSKEPDARPQTVEEFVTELREAAGLSAATTTGSFARPLGVDTVAIKPSGDTLHAPQATGENLGGTIAPAEGGVSPHTVHAGPRTEAHIPPPKPRADARATVPLDAASALEVERARGGETARQHAGNETAFMPSETAYAPGGGSASTPDAPPVGHTSWTAPTEVLPPVEQVWGAGGETQAGVPETQLMESALIERKRDELLAEQERRAEAERNAGGATSAPPLNTTPLGATNLGQQTTAGQFGLTREFLPNETVVPQSFDYRPAAPEKTDSQAPPEVSAANVYAATPAESSLPPQTIARETTPPQPPPITVHPPSGPNFMKVALIGVVALALLGGLAGAAYLALKDRDATTPTGPAARTNGGGTTLRTPGDGPPAAVTPTKPDMVELPGGTFEVGLKDVPPFTDAHTPTYLQWMYAQHPAHAVPIRPFAIDRTEVTNAEYAQFVAETGYPPPPGIWEGNRPKEGEEQWPVRNVSLEDALRFAVWRSKRDNTTYRLPTEEEWEYAARGADASRLFPWGAEWADGRANLDSDKPVAVGSFKDGETPQGLRDMIGNVWEWTSSDASMYPGNRRLKLPPEAAGMAVVRGGSYQSPPRGDKPITATTRMWQAKDKKDPVIGFRLVRPGAGERGATSNAKE